MGRKGDYSKYAQQYREAGRKYVRKMRTSALLSLGNKCIRCGFSDDRALQIDHRNGDGYTERKKLNGASFFRIVINSVSLGEGRYQLLCANCNFIKRFENGRKEMPGRPRFHP